MCNREHWAKMLPIIQAFSNGETVQYKQWNTENWGDFSSNGNVGFDGDPSNYRIKPKQGWYRVAMLNEGTTTCNSTGHTRSESYIENMSTFQRWLTDRVYYDL